MNCRECVEHLYEFLDREVTPELEQEIRAHLEDCPQCEEQSQFDELFLKFLRARCKTKWSPAQLKQRMLREMFGR